MACVCFGSDEQNMAFQGKNPICVCQAFMATSLNPMNTLNVNRIRTLMKKRVVSIAGVVFLLMSAHATAANLTQISDEQRTKSVQMLEDLREKHSDLLLDAQGILVAGVVSGSQADVAGILPGDIITSYAGRPINNSDSFVAIVSELSTATRSVDMVVIRNNTKMQVKLKNGIVGVQLLNVASLGGGLLPGARGEWVEADNKPRVFVQMGHPSGPIQSVAISPDGRFALSAGLENTVKLWEIASGREIRTFTGHSAIVSSVVFSPNGRHALSGSYDGSLRLWDIATGVTIYAFKGHSFGVTSIAISQDGRRALSGGGYEVKLWDLATGAYVRTMSDLPGQAGPVSSVAFSPNGQQALSGGYYVSQGVWGGAEHVLKLWDVASGKSLLTMAGHSSTVKAVAFSPDGRQALSGSVDKTVKLWDIAIGKEIRTMNGHSMAVDAVAFSPDGRHALSGGMELKLWDTKTGEEIRDFKGHSDLIASGVTIAQAVAFSPDGRQALSAGPLEMRLWDVGSGTQIRRLHGNSLGLGSTAFSPDGLRVLSGGDKTTKIWDVTTGKMVGALEEVDAYGVAAAIAFSPDGRQILSGHYDTTLKLRDVATGKLIRTLKGHTGMVTSVAFSRDGRQALSSGGVSDSMFKGIASTQYDGSIRLWDIATGENTRTLTGHAGPVQAVALRSDGRQALSAGSGGAKLWDIASGKELRSFSGAYQAVAFSPDGRYALSDSPDNTMKLLDLATGQEIRAFNGHSNLVQSVAFSPDGTHALSGSRDNSVKLWEVATGKVIHTLAGHDGHVKAVAFSPNGHLALSVSSDSTLRIWNLATGKEVLQMIGFFDGEWLSITPEGYFSASSPKAAENLNIRMGMNVYGIDQFYDVFYRPDIVEAALAGKDISSMVALTINDAIKNPPPVIEKVEAPASSAADTVKVAYRIKSNGGGIGEVRVFHNGKLVKSDGVAHKLPDSLLGKKANQLTSEALVSQMRGLAVAAAKNDALRGAVTSPPKPDLYESVVEIEPVPGENDISVVAFNAQNSIQSTAYTASFLSSKAPVAPRLHILAVGIDEYKDKSASLAFAVKDSRDIAARWKAQAANIYGEQNIFVETISNADANREGILAKINQIAARVKPTDHFVLFVASHGVLLGEQYYMVTSDYDGALQPSKLISANEIVDFSKRIKALSQLYILDTCHAGGMGGVVSGLYDARVSVLAKKMGLHVFASASSAEEAIDGFQGNGLFTHTLLAGLNNNKQADSNSDKQVSLMELGSYSKEQTREIAKKLSHKQDPLTINFGLDNPVYRLH